MLYICGTPIGNLQDITLRQLDILKTVDIIAAEDTRHSRKLLTHFGITTPITSYHSHSGEGKGRFLLAKLQQGKKIALITDSGMPLISDPGIDIVRMCRENNIPITTVPGPTAFVSALVLSGFDTASFTFFGFLSKKQKKDLSFLVNHEQTIILQEAPHKITKTLELLQNALGAERPIAISREITKLYEETLCFTLGEAVSYYKENAAQGEFVIVIEGREAEPEVITTPIPDQVASYMEKGFSKKEAIKMVAKDMRLPKSVVYREVV
ncbi:MAG: 16S rRNA (cytidine(1402)-2'-O)-methyltransferase [Defluviitaleaceae bacterium]|nr:16S rRNA (cytidine(1402)-2'-O)-methyltransferase [Defluviitaleaceae bacterium]